MCVADVIFVKLNVGSFHVWNVELFVIFLVCSLYDNLLLDGVDIQNICFHRVRQISNSPLIIFQSILPNKNWLSKICCTALLDLSKIG